MAEVKRLDINQECPRDEYPMTRIVQLIDVAKGGSDRMAWQGTLAELIDANGEEQRDDLIGSVFDAVILGADQLIAPGRYLHLPDDDEVRP